MNASKSSQKAVDAMFNPERRGFCKTAFAGAMGGPALLASAMESLAETPKNAPSIKICVQSSANPTDDDLLFIRQLGVEYVSVGSTPELRTAEGFQQIGNTDEYDRYLQRAIGFAILSDRQQRTKAGRQLLAYARQRKLWRLWLTMRLLTLLGS